MYMPRSSIEAAAEVAAEKPSSGKARAEKPSCCGCTGHQPREPRHPQRPPPQEFSADMLRDQELLVTTLAQQGISEALIRRQFNKLLEEQAKQLATHREPIVEAERERPPKVEARESPTAIARPRAESSSLPKLRTRREMQEARSRNNGLQDLATAAQIIDRSKSHSELAGRPQPRLNGAQDGSASPEAEAFIQAHCLRQAQPVKSRCASQVSANGLANGRRLLPTGSVKTATQQQEQQQQQQYQQQQQHQQYEQQQHHQYQQQQNQYQQQQNQHCQPGGDAQHELDAGSDEQQSGHRSTFHPDIQEPRVFGGFTYFARKPQLGCLPQFSQPHPQSPPVNSSRSTTAF